MTRVVLPVEIKVREFVGKLWLALELAQAGGKVALGPMSHVNRSLDRLEPDIYFTLSAVNRDPRRKRLKKLNNCGTRTAVLDTEGSAFGGVEQYKSRVDPEIISLVDHVFAWGEEAAAIARDFGGNDAAEKVTVTGNPRFDVLHKDLRDVYSAKTEQIRKQFGRYILFNTNFTVNRVNPERGAEMATTDLGGLYRTQTKLIGEFVTALSAISKRLPKRKVVIRPHPAEDTNLYKRLFHAFDNVVVEHDGDVRPWIRGADAVVHNSCTTGIAAAMLKTPVFAYTPEGAAVHESPIPNIVSESVEQKHELVDRIEEIESNDTHRMGDEQTHRLRRHIANINFRSTDRIVSTLEPSLDSGVSTDGFDSRFNPSPLVRLHRMFLKTVGHNPLKEPYLQLRGTDWAGYKFDGLTKTELAEAVQEIPVGERQERIRITPAKEVEHTFWLEAA